MKVNLFTRDGGFVHSAEIPDYNDPPEIVFWGTRAFRLNAHDGKQYRFVEAFAYFLPEHTAPVPTWPGMKES